MGIITKLNRLKFRLQRQLKLILVKKNKNIKIARDTIIYENVQLETNYGGSITIGSNNEILYGACLMTYGGKIDIGNNCSINPYTIIYGHGNGVKIGNNVLIAGHTMIIPSNHIYTSLHTPINQQGSTSKGIIIEDDVWLGSGVKVLDGVTIATGCVIAAGAVLIRNTEPYGVYAGTPAKRIKNRNDVKTVE